MNKGDVVQIRRFDGADHWIFATVVDPNTNQVQITHPGNREDGAIVVAAPEDLRTKADVERIRTSAVAIANTAGPRGLTETQIKQLGKLDGFWLSFVAPADGKLTEHQSRQLSNQQITVHKQVGSHYDAILKRLT